MAQDVASLHGAGRVDATGLDEGVRRRAAGALQGLLVGVIDLSLTLKQAHWNIRGPGFREMHLHLDEIVEVTRTFSDELAERIVALGIAAEGRASAVSAGGGGDAFPGGFVGVEEAGGQIVRALDAVIASGRAAQSALGEIDAVSEDLVIGGLRDLEKQRWMLSAGLDRSRQ